LGEGGKINLLIRSGIGYDVHALSKGEKLVVGGVRIPSEKGSVGHSDGDALTHSIVDALLGAAALGDIGLFFPSHEKEWKGVNSIDFVCHAVGKISEAGFKINNLDSTVILQKPKIEKFIPLIRKTLSEAIEIKKSQISIKATTTDFLGFVGDSSGWASQTIATLYKNKRL
tara:strand:- start:1080 stop:1592 length:513 start_codon:yes stop_codon:yes gene_type:complete